MFGKTRGAPVPRTLFGILPLGEGIFHKVGAVEAGVVGDFLAYPRGFGERAVFTVQLDFGDDEALVVAEELVNFPDEAVVLQAPAHFLDEGGSQSRSSSAASSGGMSYSYSDRVAPRVIPLTVRVALSPSIRTRTVRSGWVLR